MVWQTSSRANFPSFLEGLSLRPGVAVGGHNVDGDFPSFLEGLSLRQCKSPGLSHVPDFPSFLEGLSLRQGRVQQRPTGCHHNFPSFLEGLSLRPTAAMMPSTQRGNFPSFLEGLSLRLCGNLGFSVYFFHFPSFFGGAFIEAKSAETHSGSSRPISLLFRRDFH